LGCRECADVIPVTKLKKQIRFETAFGMYVVEELLGEGGAGRVYGGVGIDGMPIALKILAADRATTDKRRRFKNEIAFLARNKHPGIVTVPITLGPLKRFAVTGE
jgi:serine/threonine protein kinase